MVKKKMPRNKILFEVVQKEFFVWFILLSLSLWYVVLLVIFFNFLRTNYIDAVTDVFSPILGLAITYVFSLKTFRYVSRMNNPKLQNFSLLLGYIHFFSIIKNDINVDWIKRK